VAGALFRIVGPRSPPCSLRIAVQDSGVGFDPRLDRSETGVGSGRLRTGCASIDAGRPASEIEAQFGGGSNVELALPVRNRPRGGV